MDGNTLLQPLLSGSDVDLEGDHQLQPFMSPVVTTGIDYQSPFIPSSNYGNMNETQIFGRKTQGYGQSFVKNNMTAGNDVFHMNNGGIPMTDQISLQQQQQQQPQQPSENNAFTPISQANTLLHNLFRGDASPDPSVSFEVEEVSFPEHFYKIQRRVGGKSTQRIKNGNVTFVLKFRSKEVRDQVGQVVIKVKRTNESKLEPEKRVGEVILPAKLSYIQENQILVQVNLDSVHVTNNRKQVYSLERTQTEFNFYHLIVEVHYNNNNIVKQNTKMFKLIGKQYKAKENGSEMPTKRKRHETGSFENSSEYNSSGSGTSPLSTLTASSPASSNVEDRILRAREVVAEHIKAKTLTVDGFFLGKVMQTKQGDVAYHFLLKDDNEKFQEGEVVGFVKDPKNENKQVICKLDYNLASESILKGVVTRSQYLEAHVPEKGVRSETICMLGMVPVQVVGDVHMNEPLYASPDHPGVAVGGHQLDIKTLKEASFIGYSFSSRKTHDESSIGVVEAAVSILQSASQCLMSEKLRDMEDDFDVKFQEIKKENKNRKRCLIGVAITTTIFLLLLSILLWQLFMPGSKLRYYNCKRGRKSPHGTATFTFIPLRNHFVRPTVRGVEFTYDDLLDKMGYKQLYKTLDGPGYRYYLNIDRCAYGKLRETNDITLGQKKVYGPEIFAVDPKCLHAYYYSEGNSKWVQYNSVSWKKWKNLFCYPEPPNRIKEQKEEEDKDPGYPE